MKLKKIVSPEKDFGKVFLFSCYFPPITDRGAGASEARPMLFCL